MSAFETALLLRKLTACGLSQEEALEAANSIRIEKHWRDGRDQHCFVFDIKNYMADDSKAIHQDLRSAAEELAAYRCRLTMYPFTDEAGTRHIEGYTLVAPHLDEVVGVLIKPGRNLEWELWRIIKDKDKQDLINRMWRFHDAARNVHRVLLKR